MRKYEPLTPGHEAVGKPCKFCNVPLEAGDIPSLIGNDPTDEEERQKMEEGKAYNAVARIVHWDCAVREVAKST
jgi:hypothetical protein